MATFDVYEYLDEPKVCQISLSMTDGRKLKLGGVAQVDAPPHLTASFVPGQLAVRDIDISEKCLLSFDTGGTTLSLVTSVKEIISDHKLKLVNIESVSHEQKRDFFRIDAQVSVDLRDIPNQQSEPMEGETINISGNGILVSFPAPIPADHRVRIVINLPEPVPQKISCVGSVVRVDKMGPETYKIALNFERIEEEDQDKIIGFCLREQRKQLRLKVQVLGPA